jgi:hypothetical protein
MLRRKFLKSVFAGIGGLAAAAIVPKKSFASIYQKCAGKYNFGDRFEMRSLQVGAGRPPCVFTITDVPFSILESMNGSPCAATVGLQSILGLRLLKVNVCRFTPTLPADGKTRCDIELHFDSDERLIALVPKEQNVPAEGTH